jgi:hypothetical protein
MKNDVANTLSITTSKSTDVFEKPFFKKFYEDVEKKLEAHRSDEELC